MVSKFSSRIINLDLLFLFKIISGCVKCPLISCINFIVPLQRIEVSEIVQNPEQTIFGMGIEGLKILVNRIFLCEHSNRRNCVLIFTEVIRFTKLIRKCNQVKNLFGIQKLRRKYFGQIFIPDYMYNIRENSQRDTSYLGKCPFGILDSELQMDAEL